LPGVFATLTRLQACDTAAIQQTTSLRYLLAADLHRAYDLFHPANDAGLERRVAFSVEGHVKLIT